MFIFLDLGRFLCVCDEQALSIWSQNTNEPGRNERSLSCTFPAAFDPGDRLATSPVPFLQAHLNWKQFSCDGGLSGKVMLVGSLDICGSICFSLKLRSTFMLPNDLMPCQSRPEFQVRQSSCCHKVTFIRTFCAVAWEQISQVGYRIMKKDSWDVLLFSVPEKMALAKISVLWWLKVLFNRSDIPC